MKRKQACKVLGAFLAGALVLTDATPAPIAADAHSAASAETETATHTAVTVYIDRENGSDSADGSSAENAVKTKERALELLEKLAAEKRSGEESGSETVERYLIDVGAKQENELEPEPENVSVSPTPAGDLSETEPGFDGGDGTDQPVPQPTLEAGAVPLPDPSGTPEAEPEASDPQPEKADGEETAGEGAGLPGGPEIFDDEEQSTDGLVQLPNRLENSIVIPKPENGPTTPASKNGEPDAAGGEPGTPKPGTTESKDEDGDRENESIPQVSPGAQEKDDTEDPGEADPEDSDGAEKETDSRSPDGAKKDGADPADAPTGDEDADKADTDAANGADSEDKANADAANGADSEGKADADAANGADSEDKADADSGDDADIADDADAEQHDGTDASETQGEAGNVTQAEADPSAHLSVSILAMESELSPDGEEKINANQYTAMKTAFFWSAPIVSSAPTKEPAAPLASGSEESTVSESEKPVVSESEEPAASESEETVDSETETPVVSETEGSDIPAPAKIRAGGLILVGPDNYGGLGNQTASSNTGSGQTQGSGGSGSGNSSGGSGSSSSSGGGSSSGGSGNSGSSGSGSSSGSSGSHTGNGGSGSGSASSGSGSSSGGTGTSSTARPQSHTKTETSIKDQPVRTGDTAMVFPSLLSAFLSSFAMALSWFQNLQAKRRSARAAWRRFRDEHPLRDDGDLQ